MKLIPFSELVVINPRVKLIKAHNYPFVEMGVVQPGKKLVKAGEVRAYKGGGSKFLSGDTLFARITPCLENGKIAQFNGHKEDVGFGSTEFFVFRAKPKISDPDYVYYLSTSDYLRKPAERSMSGASGRQRADLNAIVNIEVPAPTLSTQRKIASILTAYDDLIENNLRRIKILEEMAQNLYREWIVKLRFPGHENIRFVDSELGRIPEGWEVVNLEDICTRITDGAHHSPKTSLSGYPMASVKDMHDWGFNLDSCRIISSDDFQKLKRNDSITKKNDVLIAKDGSYLKHCFVVSKDMDVALLSSIAILRPSKKINPHLLASILLDPNVKERMKGYVSGAALPRIILKEFRKFKIILPSPHIQQEWANFALPKIYLCQKLIDKNKILHLTRDLLLPKLISGEIDVSNIDIAMHEEVSS